MKNSKALFHDFVSRIHLPESRDEIQSTAFLVFESLLGLSKADIMAGRELKDDPAGKLEAVLQRLHTHEPVHYILNEAWFFGRKFFVNPFVLIPRPETEELVHHTISFCRPLPQDRRLKLIDIGTGSGCIPVTLALELPGAEVYATDISDDALAVTARNAAELKAHVLRICHNVLTQDLPLYDFDVVTSNPPYITRKEEAFMQARVVNYEPHLALFVADTDPFIFYNAIAILAQRMLRPGGMLIMEINEQFGSEIAEIFGRAGFTGVEIIDDLQGKQRMVKGLK